MEPRLLILRISVLTALASLATAEQVDLESARRSYDEFRLPYPPADAKLVIVGRRAGFLIRTETETAPPEVLIGTEMEAAREHAADLEVLDVRRVVEKGLQELQIQAQPGVQVALAVQLEARGECVAAQRILSDLVADRRLDLRAALANAAWYHWEASLTAPGTDRKVALDVLNKILTSDASCGSAKHRRLIKALEGTLAPRVPSTDAAERLIDDLTEVGARDDLSYGDLTDMMGPLIELGFDCVPALLRHLEDERLTRRLYVNPLDGERSIVSVGDLAGLYLSLLSTGEVEPLAADEKAALAKWWEKTGSRDEGSYLEAHALPSSSKLEWPNETICRVLAARHPRRLLAVYRRILNLPTKFASARVAKLLPGLALPKAEVVSALVEGAKNDNRNVRQGALFQLCDFEPDTCTPLLVHELDALPESPRMVPDEEYGCSFQSLLAMDVIHVDRKPAWEALERAARTAQPPVRLDLLCSWWVGAKDAGRSLRLLELLSRFLDDRTVVGVPKDAGDRAATREEQLRICDHVARRMACILRLTEEPSCDWSIDQWDEFIRRVREELPLRNK